MTVPEVKAALAAMNLTPTAFARQAGISHQHMHAICNGKRGVSANVAGKVKEMLLNIKPPEDWQTCPFCGKAMELRPPRKNGSGFAVIHTCEASGCSVRISTDLGVTPGQLQAALGRRHHAR